MLRTMAPRTQRHSYSIEERTMRKLTAIAVVGALGFASTSAAQLVCGVEDPSPEIVQLVESLQAKHRNSILTDSLQSAAIPVSINLITDGSKGNYPDSVFENLVHNLNVGFSE